MSDDAKRKQIQAEFKEAVNMTPKQIETWLETEQSRSVGQTPEGETEATGHREGRRLVEILHKKHTDLTDEDYSHMAKIVGYVHRHMKQRPSGDVTDTRWRFSLMNWGHDPNR